MYMYLLMSELHVGCVPTVSTSLVIGLLHVAGGRM